MFPVPLIVKPGRKIVKSHRIRARYKHARAVISIANHLLSTLNLLHEGGRSSQTSGAAKVPTAINSRALAKIQSFAIEKARHLAACGCVCLVAAMLYLRHLP